MFRPERPRDSEDEVSRLRARVASLETQLASASGDGGLGDFLLDRISDGVVGVDAEGNVLFANDAMTFLTGVTREEMIGKPPGTRWKEVADEAANPLNGTSLLSQIERVDGTRRVVAVRPFRYDRPPLAYVIVYRDVTQRKAIERESRQREEIAFMRDRLDNILASLDEVVWSMTPDFKTHLYTNPAVEKVYGHTVEDFARNPSLWESMLHPEDRERAKGYSASVEKLGFAEATYRIIRSDGEVRLLHERIRLIRDSAGTPIRIDGISSDITDQVRREDAAKARHRLMKNFLQSSPAALAVFDREMRYILVSQRWLQDFNTTEEALIGKGLYELIPSLAEDHRFIHYRALEGEPSGLVEETLVRDNGGLDWFQWEVRPWHDENGKIGGIVMFSEIITERVRATAVLREAEERSRAIISAIPDTLLELSADGFINESHIPETGKNTALALDTGAGHINGVFPDEKDRVADAMRMALESGTVQILEFVTSLEQFVEARIAPTAQGTFLLLVRNISERRRVQEELRAREELYRLVIEATNDCVWDWNLTTGRAYFSRQWKTMLGYEEETTRMTMDRWRDLVHPEDQVNAASHLRAHLDSSVPFVSPRRMQHRDGTYRWMNCRGFALRDSKGRPTRMIGILSDMSAQKEAEDALRRAKEAAEAADRAKSQFLAVMSHEIRTPMNGIINFANLLQDTTLDLRQSEYVDTIRSSSESLLVLLNDILDFSKIESGSLELESVPLNVRDCIEDVLELGSQVAAGKDLELYPVVSPEVPPMVLADPARLRQVLVNLVGNAMKFTAAGEVCVRAWTQKDRLYFSVRDTGIGIPAAKIERLFKPFSQADSSTTRRFGGTGLGLAICQRLVTLMGGTVRVDSKDGEGTTFSFDIPLAAAAGGSGRETPLPLPSARALVLDDAPGHRAAVVAALISAGLEVQFAPVTGFDSGMLPATGAFEVVILNASPRDQQALAAVAKLARRQAGRTLPAIFLLPAAQVEGFPMSTLDTESQIVAKPIRRLRMARALHRALNPQGQLTPRTLLPVERQSSFGNALPLDPSLKVLVAEDNLVNQRVIVLLLEKLGLRADMVPNGEEAVTACKAKQYDIVLMDLQMPGMDGHEATQHIRAYEKHSGIPATTIIALTADAADTDRERCLAGGMNDFVSKPIDFAQLAGALRRGALR